MKSKTKHRGGKSNKRIKIRHCTSYEPDFKKAVVLYAEQKSTSEAKKRYGISESNIRRWRRLKNDIMEKASQPKVTRKSGRIANTFESSLEESEFSSSLDSMPLEQRLKAEPEPVLQSQPLSPTKLKVTRQSMKLPQQPPKPKTPEPPNEEVCLRWNSHHSNMQSSFPNLLMREQYVDATLVAEGQSLKCHRLILSSCSPYFEEVLAGISPFQHPVLFMKDIPFWVLKSLCDFMYAGEVHIYQNKLEELLAVAESLKIKGLAGKSDGPAEEAKSPVEPQPKSREAAKEEKKEEKEVKERRRGSTQHLESTPKPSTKPVRVQAARRTEKNSKESLSKENILDPLDLLEPVYEEVTKESSPPKLREMKTVPVKKGKFKKRKLPEEREESPPPMFLSRKGTRSRPNVKIPKYYHTHYERVSESTIVREPHTEQPDPLMEVEEIKAEPLDLDDDVIEIEDNVITFTDMPELQAHDEEIIGNYDSPIVNLAGTDKSGKEDQVPFKKISLVPQPIIMNVHSVEDKSSNTVQIVDVTQLKDVLEKGDDPLATCKIVDDPLNFVIEPTQKGTESITITNVQSMADVEEDVGEKSSANATNEAEAETAQKDTNCVFQIEKVVSADEAELLINAEQCNEKIGEDESTEVSFIEDVDVSKNLVEERDNFEGNEDGQGENVTMENENEAATEQIGNDGQNSAEPEETGVNDAGIGGVELGFHVAKVASEFSMNEATEEVVSEECASDLGFRITDVVSGQMDDANDAIIGLEEATILNHVEELREGADPPEAGEGLAEDAQLLADTLEQLLDK